MFQKFKNIETAFQHVRGFTIIIIIGCFGAIGYIEYQNKSLVKTMQSRLYVLYNGKVLEAIATDRKGNLAVEARDHIRTFHELFFTLAPDEKVIQTNLAKALYLADASAKDEYDNLRENGYFANMIAGNVSQQLQIDSIAVDLRSYPYHFRCYGIQNIVRTSSTVSRSLITEGELRSVSRSDNNPHGFLIQRWHTIENEDLKVDNH
jgi:conjugative transposon TraK protein